MHCKSSGFTSSFILSDMKQQTLPHRTRTIEIFCLPLHKSTVSTSIPCHIINLKTLNSVCSIQQFACFSCTTQYSLSLSLSLSHTHTHTHTYVCTYMHTTYVHTYIHTYIRMYVHTTYVRTYIHTYVHAYYVCTYIHTYVQSCKLLTYVRTYIRTCILHTYIHTHTSKT